MARPRLLMPAALAVLFVTVLPAHPARAVNPYALYHQAAADMAAASSFVERSVITERAATLVIGRTVISEYDQQHNRVRIHAYETRRTRDAHGAWHARSRYLDIIFLGSHTYIRTTPGLRWQVRGGSRYTDAGWRDDYSNVAPSFGDLPRAGLHLAGASHGQVHLQIRSAKLSEDLWITVSPTSYLTRYRAAYDREVAGLRTQVQEDSRFYGFNRTLKIVAPVSAAAGILVIGPQFGLGPQLPAAGWVQITGTCDCSAFRLALTSWRPSFPSDLFVRGHSRTYAGGPYEG